MDLTNDDEQNWALLRQRSLQPGGFGEDRARIWPALLGAQPLSDPPPYSEVEGTSKDANSMNGSTMDEAKSDAEIDPHADERQIKLDTDRSFVLYPVESSSTPPRDTLQSDLHELLVSLFRKRRSLHYFQGFHDIITVLYLTLPKPLHFVCAEKMALHRVRDAMGVGLEPVLGLLRILRNLLRLADPEYAKLLESTSPLPYHALSHLLTLFSHDVPTPPLIQHVWDFLLCREPIAVVWLAAALVLHRKPSVYKLAEQDEEGMIHSLLSGIPELVDAEPEPHSTGDSDPIIDLGCTANATEVSSVTAAKVPRTIPEQANASSDADATIRMGRHNGKDELSPDEVLDQPDYETVDTSPSDVAQATDAQKVNSSITCSETIPFAGGMSPNIVDNMQDRSLEIAASIPLPDSRSTSPSLPIGDSPCQRAGSQLDHSPLPTWSHTRSRTDSYSSDSRHSSTRSQSATASNTFTPHFLNCPSAKSRVKPPPLPLSYLLSQADALLTTYPPSHRSLCVAEIMGPDSVMYTWTPPRMSTNVQEENLPYNQTDDYLETLVNSSHVVIPSPPPSPPPGPRLQMKKTKDIARRPPVALMDPRSIGLRLGALSPAERRVLFVGALLVVGAAVALKSGRVPCVGNVSRGGENDVLKRLWNGKWTLFSSIISAWGRGLP